MREFWIGKVALALSVITSVIITILAIIIIKSVILGIITGICIFFSLAFFYKNCYDRIREIQGRPFIAHTNGELLKKIGGEKRKK